MTTLDTLKDRAIHAYKKCCQGTEEGVVLDINDPELEVFIETFASMAEDAFGMIPQIEKIIKNEISGYSFLFTLEDMNFRYLSNGFVFQYLGNDNIYKTFYSLEDLGQILVQEQYREKLSELTEQMVEP